jgi:hypothetical protein
MLAGVTRRASLLFASVMAVVLSPAVAWACPACAGTGAQNAMFLKIGSLFVLVPFAVVGLVLYVLRHAPGSR